MPNDTRKQKIQDLMKTVSRRGEKVELMNMMLRHLLERMRADDPKGAEQVFIEAILGATRVQLQMRVEDVLDAGKVGLSQTCAHPEHTPENKARAAIVDMLVSEAIKVSADNHMFLTVVEHNMNKHSDGTAELRTVSSRAEFDDLPDEVKSQIPQEIIDKLH